MGINVAQLGVLAYFCWFYHRVVEISKDENANLALDDFKNSQKYGKFEVHILSTIWKIPKYNFYKLLWGS